MAVASEYSEFLAAGERRRAALRSKPLHVAIVVGYGAICGVGAADINTGLLLLITLAGIAALRAILKSLPVLAVVAVLAVASAVFPPLAILPIGYGVYLLFRRLRFFLENFTVIVLGLVLYGGALLLQVYGADLANMVHLPAWTGAPGAGLLGALGAHILLLRAYALGYTTRRAFEIMSIVPLLLLSLLLPLIKVAFEIHPGIAVDAHAGVGEAFAAGDAMASPVALAGEFGAAGAIAHAHGVHVGVHHEPADMGSFEFAHHGLPVAAPAFHEVSPELGHWSPSTPHPFSDGAHAGPGIHDAPADWPPTAAPHAVPGDWHVPATPVDHGAHFSSAGHLGSPHAAGTYGSDPAGVAVHHHDFGAPVHSPAGQLELAFHRQLDGIDHVVGPDAHVGATIHQMGNHYQFHSQGQVNHELRDVGGGRYVSQHVSGQAQGVVAPGLGDGGLLWKNNLGQVRYEAQPFGGQISIKDAMGHVVRTVGAQGWNAARFDLIVRGLG